MATFKKHQIKYVVLYGLVTYELKDVNCSCTPTHQHKLVEQKRTTAIKSSTWKGENRIHTKSQTKDKIKILLDLYLNMKYLITKD